MGHRFVALLFDIDGTLIDSGGAGAASWKSAFDDLYGIPADIGEFTDSGMTDPDVGRGTFEAVLDREPSHWVMNGVEDLLPSLLDDGYPLGVVTGNLEAAAHIKMHRARLNRYFSFGGYGSDADDRGEVTRIALERARRVYGGDDAGQLRAGGADWVITSLTEGLPL